MISNCSTFDGKTVHFSVAIYNISSAMNLDDFIRLLSEAVVTVLKENSKISKVFQVAWRDKAR